MKIGIYNPYIDSLGGGERYALTIASHWSKNHEVCLFWDDADILKKAEERLGINLTRVSVARNIFLNQNIFNKLWETRRYDCIFFLSDGSVSASFAKRNILHFQVPFSRVSIHPIKFHQYQAIVCNSEFTKNHLDPRLSIRSKVIYPPVDTKQFQFKEKKEKIILSVGRFTSYFQAKKQEVLIDVWEKAVKNQIFSGWTLIFAGGLLPSDEEYFQSLKKKASKLPITCMPNISFSDLRSLYSKASFYWHAAGVGEKDPKLMEHFGITTVEAMASGCIPLVYNGGGLPEIIEDQKNGFLWNTPDELIDQTVHLVFQKKIMEKMRISAKNRAELFNEKRFCDEFDHLLKSII